MQRDVPVITVACSADS